jgi:hypothetical protein
MNKKNDRTLGEMIDELVRRWKAGEKVTVFISEAILSDAASMLAREGFRLAKDALNMVENTEHRQMLSTLLGSTVAFSVAGAVVGGSLAGPSGILPGAAFGAAIGLAAGCFTVTLNPDPDGRGYTFNLG